MIEVILNVIKRLKYRIKLVFKIFINIKFRYYMYEGINKKKFIFNISFEIFFEIKIELLLNLNLFEVENRIICIL